MVLYHSLVESPDMMNIYNGNITTDQNGEAVVTLPGWFETLNSDFRYQLTVVGQFAQAIITSKKVSLKARAAACGPCSRPYCWAACWTYCWT